MEYSLATFKPLLTQLVLSVPLPKPQSGKLRTPGPQLSDEQMMALLDHLTDTTFTSNLAHSAVIGSALTVLRTTGTDMNPLVIAHVRRRLVENAQLVVPPVLKPSGYSYTGFVDMVGTGGDGQDTFNVSTTAVFVAGGVDGMRVCKHGGKASSSTSGSSDMLMALGIPLLDVDISALGPVLEELPCSFLFAPKVHSTLAPLAPIRASLGFPSLFNLAGPLSNPIQPARGVYGVHSSGIGLIYAEALRMIGMERVWVVCGQEGLDEISPAGPTDVWELRDGEIDHFIVSPADFGVQTHPLAHVRCGTASENASVVVAMFGGHAVEDVPLAQPLVVAPDAPGEQLAPIPQNVNIGAIYDYTIIQAAALLHVAGRGSLPACAELARASIASRRAHAALSQLRVAMTTLAK